MDERDVPPVLISAYVADDMSEVRIRGFVRTQEFLDSATIKPAYAGSHTNYALSVDELSAMPVPNTDRMELGDDYQLR